MMCPRGLHGMDDLEDGTYYCRRDRILLVVHRSRTAGPHEAPATEYPTTPHSRDVPATPARDGSRNDDG